MDQAFGFLHGFADGKIVGKRETSERFSAHSGFASMHFGEVSR